MVEVNHLEQGVNPPEEEHTVVVARDVTGGFYVISSEPGYRRGAPAQQYPVSEGERAVVIERAKALADKSGVSTVYVVT
jgi:hypothetical protein